MNPEIRAAIEKADAIPTMPQLVMRLLEITNDLNYKQSDIVDLLSSDPGTASDVLKLANSALFGMTRRISSLRHALTLLGMKRTRTLVIGRCMIDRSGAGPQPALNMGYYWRRSLATGVLAARLGDRLTPGRREEAFMSGLLCDIGMVVLARAFPAQYAPVAQAYGPLPSAALVARELAEIGAAHPEISALVLEKWMLPEQMIAAIGHHHDSPIANLPELAGALARIISAAGEIAQLLCETPAPEAVRATCAAVLATVGMQTGELGRILTEIGADIVELAAVLRIELIPSTAYEHVARCIEPEAAAAAV